MSAPNDTFDNPAQYLRHRAVELAVASTPPDRNPSYLLCAAKRIEDYIRNGVPDREPAPNAECF